MDGLSCWWNNPEINGYCAQVLQSLSFQEKTFWTILAPMIFEFALKCWQVFAEQLSHLSISANAFLVI